MDKQTLNAQKRSVFGRKVKTLRNEGLLPSNVYGKKTKSKALQVDMGDFLKIYEKAGETGLIELKISTKSSKKIDKVTVLVSDVQTNPTTDKPIHIDFRQVDLKEKIVASVPIEAIGESPAEKQGLGTIVMHIDQVEVEALPANLPEKFEIDLSKLEEVDQSIQVKDLSVEKSKVDIKADPEEIIVKVEPLRAEEEEPSPVAEETEEDVVEGEEEGGETKEGEVEKGAKEEGETKEGKKEDKKE